MKTALLIDNDEVSRGLIGKLLRQDGWHLLQSETGEKGVALATQYRPDLVICDLSLPGFTGFQVCRTLRENRELANTRLVVTSVRDYPADRQGAMEAGAQAYLTKPIDSVLLTRIIEKVMRPDLGVAAAEHVPMTAPGQPTSIRFWGVRGSIPTPGPETVHYGGNTSCVEVRGEGELIILDAGSGIRPLGLSLLKEFQDKPMELTILITHTHWDHIQGFPFFVPAYQPRNSVHILGYEGARHGLEETLSGQMESPYFPIGFKQMPGNIAIRELNDLNFMAGNVRVKAAYMHHPGICVGYRLFLHDGSITYIPDNEPYLRMKSYPTTRGDGSSAETLAYARTQDEKLTEFIAGSDVLIMDSQYDAQEYASHAGWGHSCLDDTVALAIQGGVKKLFLFHHDPGHDDKKIDALVVHARELAAKAGAKIQIEAAREGVELRLSEPLPAGKTAKRGKKAEPSFSAEIS
ncbi:MAG: response regulator [Verrucomicrobiota bacterium]